MAITISGENNNDRILAADGVIDQISGINFSGIITASHIDVGSNIQLGNAGIITATTFVGNLTGNVNSTSPLLLQTGGSERFRITGNNELGIAGANYGSSGQVLTSGGSGSAVSWTTPATQTTIVNYADNKLVTATGNATTLNAQGNLTWDESKLTVTSASKDLLYLNSTHSEGPQISIQTSGTTFSYIGSAASLFSTGSSTDLGFRAESGKHFLFGIGSSEKVRIASNGRVGINTDNPQTTLYSMNEIAAGDGNRRFIGMETKVVSGTAVGEIRTTYYSGANGNYPEMRFVTHDTERLRINSNGTVHTLMTGTAPSWLGSTIATREKFSIFQGANFGEACFNIDVDNANSFLSHNMYYNGGWKIRKSGSPVRHLEIGTNGWTFMTGADGSDDTGSALTTRLRINADGKINIGTLYNASTTHLDIRFDDTTAYSNTSNHVNGLKIFNDCTTDNGFAGIELAATDGDDYYGSTLLKSVADGTNYSNDFVIQTRHSGNYNERFRINSDGDVGIGNWSGTNIPQTLSVFGNMYMRQGDYITWNNGDCEIGGISGYHLKFSTYNGSSMTEAMQIKSDSSIYLPKGLTNRYGMYEVATGGTLNPSSATTWTWDFYTQSSTGSVFKIEAYFNHWNTNSNYWSYQEHIVMHRDAHSSYAGFDIRRHAGGLGSWATEILSGSGTYNEKIRIKWNVGSGSAYMGGYFIRISTCNPIDPESLVVA